MASDAIQVSRAVQTPVNKGNPIAIIRNRGHEGSLTLVPRATTQVQGLASAQDTGSDGNGDERAVQKSTLLSTKEPYPLVPKLENQLLATVKRHS